LPDFDRQVDKYAEILTMQEVSSAIQNVGRDVSVADGRVRAYRALIAEPDWVSEQMMEKPIGVYWSYDRAGVGAYDADLNLFEKPVEVLVTGSIRLADVDWTETLALKAGGRYSHGEEFEIRVLPSAVVRIDNVEWRENDFSFWHAKQVPSKAPWQQANFSRRGIELLAGQVDGPAVAIAI
jgi:hypothetical protein